MPDFDSLNARPAPKLDYMDRTNNHSIRCSDELWTLAREKAKTEGVSINYTIEKLLEGFVLGHYKLPKLRIDWS